MIDLPTREPVTRAIHQRLIHLAALQPHGWTLVGAQMVALHAHEQNRRPPRGTTDADVVVNVRAVQDATERFSRLLVDNGFQLDGVSPEGIGHRFTDGTVKIDVLAPDGLDRRRARLLTVPPARTLRRLVKITVTFGRRSIRAVGVAHRRNTSCASSRLAGAAPRRPRC